MKVYNFKVALEYHKRTYRLIEILENQTLEDLHEMIFKAFDRDEEHLYSFYITKTSTRSREKRYKSPEYTDSEFFDDDFNLAFQTNKFDASEAYINSLGLRVKDKIYYLFDFGDCWWHEITLISISQTEKIDGYPKIIKKAGKSPPQYPDFE